jgi:hypothetical protein
MPGITRFCDWNHNVSLTHLLLMEVGMPAERPEDICLLFKEFMAAE